MLKNKKVKPDRMVGTTMPAWRTWSSVAKASTLIFFAGNVLLLLLIIISGGSDNYPMSRLYWVEGDTRGIPNAPNTTRWAYWGACSRSNGHTRCRNSLGPAYPISPVDNFHTETNVPQKFISKRSSLYYLTRLAFSFFWIALSFIATSFLIYMGSWFSNAVSYVVWILTGVGCLFNIVAVIFQTAAAVMARDAFTDAHRHGKLGAPLLGIAWASVVLCMIEFTSLVLGHFFWSRTSRADRLHEKAVLPSVKITGDTRSGSTESAQRFRTFFLGSRKAPRVHDEAEKVETPSNKPNTKVRSNSTGSVHPFRTFFLGPRNARAYDDAVSKQRESDQGYTISSGTTEGGNGTGGGGPTVNFSNAGRSDRSESHDLESV